MRRRSLLRSAPLFDILFSNPTALSGVVAKMAMSYKKLMSNGECVATNVIERICKALNCDVGGIVERVPGKETGAAK